MTVTDTEPSDASAEQQEKERPAAEEPREETPARALERMVEDPGALEDTIPGWREMQGLAAMAVTLAAAQSIPVALRGRPNDVFLVLLTARELGVAPTAALRTVHVINGVASLAPKLRSAMVRQQGLGRIWPDEGNDRTRATWHATRADEGHERTYSFTFTIEDAQSVKESGNKTLDQKDNWQGYPQRMLSWRALGYLLDDVFPEVGTGLYSADELGAVTDEEGLTVIDVRATDPLTGMDKPRGHHGSTPPPPNPNDQPITAEERAELQGRIDALGKIEQANEHGVTARSALVQLWMHQAEGAEPLPVIHALLRRHLPKAKAMVFSIEGRAKKGEWGPWPPADPPTPPDAATSGPPAPEAVPDAPTQPDAAPDVPAPTEAVPDAPPEGSDAADLVARAAKLAEKAGAVAAESEPEPEVPAPLAPEPQSLMEAMEQADPGNRAPDDHRS